MLDEPDRWATQCVNLYRMSGRAAAGMEIPPRAHPPPPKKSGWVGGTPGKNFQKFWHSHDARQAAGPAMSVMLR
jgi:hypothetical protein